MNYFELHIGDYEKATAHLTACEDGIYGRLMRRYYDTEAPLPDDVKALQRFVRARSRDEKEAVQTVLDEFFQLEADGWHHKRCDEELATYREKMVGAGAKRDNEVERQRRHRERRKVLFEQLRELGIVPDYDTPTKELEDTLSRVTSPYGNAPVTRDITRTNKPVTPAATATHTPDTKHQTPEELNITQAPKPPTEEVRACMLLRQAGCQRVNPSDPNLQAAITEGVTPEFLRDTYLEFPDASNPFKYAISTARGRHAEGPKPLNGASHANRSTGRKLSLGEQVEQNIRDRQARERSGDGGVIEGTYIAIGS